ncbi:hypothetical protein [Microbacterium flavescens]|jgi:hypothetical protein|uniref:hypothetical protein n=1 Tax=Microbacterium flavescens TaxID=69366 RepID=UPI001BDF5AB9|nr:hypothetical protein [Microbacterium flavescens]
MWVFVIPGILLVVVGAVWALQGIGMLGGSAMTGSTTWAVIGPIVVGVGLVLIVIGIARRSRSR